MTLRTWSPPDRPFLWTLLRESRFG